jgi:hypothetical protein
MRVNHTHHTPHDQVEFRWHSRTRVLPQCADNSWLLDTGGGGRAIDRSRCDNARVPDERVCTLEILVFAATHGGNAGASKDPGLRDRSDEILGS